MGFLPSRKVFRNPQSVFPFPRGREGTRVGLIQHATSLAIQAWIALGPTSCITRT